MKIKALNNFCGSLCMAKGEIRECNDETVLTDLLNAGYIKPAEEEPGRSGGKRENTRESGRKQASGSEGADSSEGQ